MIIAGKLKKTINDEIFEKPFDWCFFNKNLAVANSHKRRNNYISKSIKFIMRKIIIFGTSGHAKVVAEAIIKMDKFDLLGFIDNKKMNTNKDVYKGYKILGDDDVIISLSKVFPDLLAHIGVGDNKIRKKIFNKFSYLQFPTIIHPSSTTLSNDVTIDDSSFVVSSVSIINGSQIGKHVIFKYSFIN